MLGLFKLLRIYKCVSLDFELAEKDNLTEYDPFTNTALNSITDGEEPKNEAITLSELIKATKKDDGNKKDKKKEKVDKDVSSEDSLSSSSENMETKNEKKQQAKTSKPTLGPKLGTPFWTNVMVDKKAKDVLVNVKTVTIIESIAEVVKGNQEPRSSGKQASDPYIKIKLPPSKDIKEAKANKEKEGKKEKKSKSPKDAKKVQKKPKKEVPTTSKPLEPISSGVKKADPKETAKKPASNREDDAFSNPTVDGKKGKGGSPKVESGESLGSIFNVLRSMPYGGKSNESLYVEGVFKFPKKPELKSNTYKISGYISNN